MPSAKYVAPDDERCEALVRGHPGWNPPADSDHRCPRRANQMRGLSFDTRVIRVCYQHAKAEQVVPYE
jgi:hypothetical protein